MPWALRKRSLFFVLPESEINANALFWSQAPSSSDNSLGLTIPWGREQKGERYFCMVFQIVRRWGHIWIMAYYMKKKNSHSIFRCVIGETTNHNYQVPPKEYKYLCHRIFTGIWKLREIGNWMFCSAFLRQCIEGSKVLNDIQKHHFVLANSTSFLLP